MKKFYLYIVSAAVAAVFCGCCHVQVWTEPVAPDTPAPQGMQAAAYGRIMNSGYYLFNCIPIYTGHPYHPNRKHYRAFHDDLRPEMNTNVLHSEMRRQYKIEKLVNIEHRESSWGYFSLWILWRKTIMTSAVGIKKAEKESNSAKK